MSIIMYSFFSRWGVSLPIINYFKIRLYVDQNPCHRLLGSFSYKKRHNIHFYSLSLSIWDNYWYILPVTPIRLISYILVFMLLQLSPLFPAVPTSTQPPLQTIPCWCPVHGPCPSVPWPISSLLSSSQPILRQNDYSSLSHSLDVFQIFYSHNSHLLDFSKKC